MWRRSWLMLAGATNEPRSAQSSLWSSPPVAGDIVCDAPRIRATIAVCGGLTALAAATLLVIYTAKRNARNSQEVAQ